MALDYRKCAEEIFAQLGGKENLVSAAHCATRLRLVVVDNNKVNTKALEDVEGVRGTFESNGQLQIIIGTGTVNKVYDEFLAITGLTAATKDEVKAAAAAQMPVWKRMLKTVGDVFVPILPAIVASGLMMGLVEALGKIDALNFASTDWYGFLDMVANTAFAYLPVIVAISAARVFGGNIFLGAVIGLLMIHSNLTNGWNAAQGYDVWYLFGHVEIGNYTLGQINQLGYQGHVIPVIISVWCMSNIEKWLHKKVPEMLDLFITPLVTVFTTALLTFMLIGPVFSTAETYILQFAQWLITVGFGVGALAMGAIYPLTVVMGLHHMYNVIEAGMLADTGLNIWMPIASAANFAQFGACLAVGIKTKSGKRKAVAIPSALSAALGITEPAIFGVNLRLMKPFVFGMIGGAAGAMFGAIAKIGATAYGVTGIPGYLTINHIAPYTIMLAIAGGVAFALTFFFWHEEIEVEEDDDKKEEPKKVVTAPVDDTKSEVSVEDLADVISCNKSLKIKAPVIGEAIPYTEIPDDAFASGALGNGVGITPETEEVLAPFDGEIVSVVESKHAVGIKSKDGVELLIHVGIDTVKMNGEGFTCFVNEGDTVKAGDKLVHFDRATIKEAGYSDMVVVLVTNSFEFDEVKAL
ncbi:MAG: PTS glucose transporter subunit IIA [Lachnospiraceae bacterium]|nr:PTS glucose transporter subunit IIA [Lachnospiraceae bacterium]